ncbi:hypothetical protein RDI58_000484 [Solanum bulbocastanum]|uniref:Uncharacterized protein n=1 Tax=Solanum bulbocastanum TaxID=147425 RepID=A0AAN8UC47_SOLBU
MALIAPKMKTYQSPKESDSHPKRSVKSDALDIEELANTVPALAYKFYDHT